MMCPEQYRYTPKNSGAAADILSALQPAAGCTQAPSPESILGCVIFRREMLFSVFKQVICLEKCFFVSKLIRKCFCVLDDALWIPEIQWVFRVFWNPNLACIFESSELDLKTRRARTIDCGQF